MFGILFPLIGISIFIPIEGLLTKIQLDTKLGRLTGNVNTSLNVRQFLNIPYAKPPLGNLRFAKPEPYGNWSDSLDATKLGPACIQNEGLLTVFQNVSEDCLQLNIYTPNTLPKPGFPPLSVMVWIHGGGYTSGSGASYDGSIMAASTNIIIVTINYRLNILGFMSYDNSVVRGNYGLWDQIMALQWVKDNIDDYGGNPDDVTIFGESAGGFSVGLLSLMPRNKGLFHRAILQSGVSNSLFTIGKHQKTMSTLEGLYAGCPFNALNTRATLDCMRQLGPSQILNGSKTLAEKYEDSPSIAIGHSPVVDGELLKRNPDEILTDSESEELSFFRSLDIMVGTTDSEGSLLLLINDAVQQKYEFNLTKGMPYEYICNTMIPSFTRDYFNSNSRLSDAVCTKYGVKNDIEEQARQAVNMYTDIFFLSPAIQTLNVHAKSNIRSSYQYVFSHRAIPLPGFPDEPSWFRGAAHGTELIYLFFLELVPFFSPNTPIKLSDTQLATTMRKYWTNFAKTGNPNPDSVLPEWPAYSVDKQSFLQLNANNMTVGRKYNEKRVNFWLKTVHQLVSSEPNLASNILTELHFKCFITFIGIILRYIYT